MKKNIKIWEETYPNGIKSKCTFETKKHLGEGYYILYVSYSNFFHYHNAWEKQIHTTEQRKKWIQDAVDELHYAVERSKHEIVDGSGESLEKYYKSFADRAVMCKLVACAPEESWSGDWIKNGVAHFLVAVFKTYDHKTDDSGRKPKTVSFHNGTYYIWCCGNDDTDAVKRNLTLQEATDLYNLAIDGVSRKELAEFGIKIE